jgi:hypothetical protein
MSSEFDTRIESWAAEFTEAPEARAFPAKIRESCQNLLAEFMGGACAEGCDPSQVGEAEVKAGLLDRVGGLELPKDVRSSAPRGVRGSNSVYRANSGRGAEEDARARMRSASKILGVFT